MHFQLSYMRSIHNLWKHPVPFIRSHEKYMNKMILTVQYTYGIDSHGEHEWLNFFNSIVQDARPEKSTQTSKNWFNDFRNTLAEIPTDRNSLNQIPVKYLLFNWSLEHVIINSAALFILSVWIKWIGTILTKLYIICLRIQRVHMHSSPYHILPGTRYMYAHIS